jgi:predicted Fe-Mo cluster-binding NifX family protein
MKIALPTTGNVVDEHFGHCQEYTVLTIDDSKQIKQVEVLPSQQGCGCKSNIASILQQKGVTLMLAGNMGTGAVNVLANHGIEVLRGCSGDVMKIAESYLKGTLRDSGMTCSHHEHHGHHGHQLENK